MNKQWLGLAPFRLNSNKSQINKWNNFTKFEINLSMIYKDFFLLLQPLGLDLIYKEWSCFFFKFWNLFIVWSNKRRDVEEHFFGFDSVAVALRLSAQRFHYHHPLLLLIAMAHLTLSGQMVAQMLHSHSHSMRQTFRVFLHGSNCSLNCRMTGSVSVKKEIFD